MAHDQVLSEIDRRKALKIVGAAGVVGMAGCLGDGGDDDDDTGGDNDTDGDDGDGGGQTLAWHAGGQSGTYYPLSNEIKDIVDNNTDYNLQVQATGASVENAGNLGRGEADFAMIQNDIAYFAVNGTGIEDFEGQAIENIRGVATLYPETIHIVTRPDANIQSLEDLNGASVNTGDIGSGTQVNALTILETVGITQEDINEQNTDFGAAADQLRDGDVDAAFVVGGWPVGAVEDLGQTADIDILNIDDETRQQLLDAAEWFAEDTIPSDAYSGIDQDVDTVSVQAMIATQEDVNADTVEEVTAAIFDNIDQIDTKGEFIDVESAQEGMSIDLHEGAARYFE
ncbi:TAXI family TRAP transporter solute-binding subunit [Haloferacaceae archaeon DSL9]